MQHEIITKSTSYGLSGVFVDKVCVAMYFDEDCKRLAEQLRADNDKAAEIKKMFMEINLYGHHQ